jgi:hypothetical protein
MRVRVHAACPASSLRVMDIEPLLEAPCSSLARPLPLLSSPRRQRSNSQLRAHRHGQYQPSSCCTFRAVSPVRTATGARHHHGRPQSSEPPPSSLYLQPPSTRTDRTIAFPVPCRPSRAPRLTIFAPAVDRRRSAGWQAVGCRGRTTTVLFGPSQGHQLGCGGPLVLVLPLAAAAGDPTSPEPRVQHPPLPVSGGRRRIRLPLSLCVPFYFE